MIYLGVFMINKIRVECMIKLYRIQIVLLKSLPNIDLASPCIILM